MSVGKEKERGDPPRDKSGSRDSSKEYQPEGERPPEIQSNMQAMIAAEVAKAIKDILPTYLKPQAEVTTGGTSGSIPVQPEERERVVKRSLLRRVELEYLRRQGGVLMMFFRSASHTISMGKMIL